MKFDYSMVTFKNGDRITIQLAEAKDLGIWFRTEIEEKLGDVRTISFHSEGKVILSMTVYG